MSIGTQRDAGERLLRQVVNNAVALCLKIRSINGPYTIHSNNIEHLSIRREHCTLIEHARGITIGISFAWIKMDGGDDLVIKDVTTSIVIQVNGACYSQCCVDRIQC